jgi:hypothetical protein
MKRQGRDGAHRHPAALALMHRGDHHHAAHAPADNLPEGFSIQRLLIDSLASHLKGVPLSSTTSRRSGSVWHLSLAGPRLVSFGDSPAEAGG